ncbi:potassium channel family protein [Microlunatus ginsengisoli]|uniref:potassium channel family protein n=1 Tax=Microlunatus ginsengisoli TaxID=363863 RepID=UPI003CD079A0
MAELSPRNFGGHLSHTDGLYFTVTVFSTVGFGDITAKTDTARLIVTVQMITDLVVLGLGIKVITGGSMSMVKFRVMPLPWMPARSVNRSPVAGFINSSVGVVRIRESVRVCGSTSGSSMRRRAILSPSAGASRSFRLIVPLSCRVDSCQPAWRI